MKIFSASLISMLLTITTYCQITLHSAIGVSVPFNGYQSMVDPGLYLNVGANKHLSNSNFNLGISIGWAKMHSDNNPDDLFSNARIDQIPIIFYSDYELSNRKLIPYVGLGLGVSLYNINYDASPTTGETIFNASFSIMPKLGLKFNATDHLIPMIEYCIPFVLDGPPAGAEKADKATGAMGLSIGLGYRF